MQPPYFVRAGNMIEVFKLHDRRRKPAVLVRQSLIFNE